MGTNWWKTSTEAQTCDKRFKWAPGWVELIISGCKSTALNVDTIPVLVSVINCGWDAPISFIEKSGLPCDSRARSLSRDVGFTTFISTPRFLKRTYDTKTVGMKSKTGECQMSLFSYHAEKLNQGAQVLCTSISNLRFIFRLGNT